MELFPDSISSYGLWNYSSSCLKGILVLESQDEYRISFSFIGGGGVETLFVIAALWYEGLKIYCIVQ